jgi:UDP-GlcNAc:undecaprenyl-phosphate GlcNAc-1-phosphate transferase
MTGELTAGAIACVAAAAATPIVRRLALRVGAIDRPGDRRVHASLLPRAGGLAVAIGVAAAVLSGAAGDSFDPWVLAGLALVLTLGLVDDLVSLRPLPKLSGQILAALLAVGGGLRSGCFGPAPSEALGLVDAGLTLAWIVAVTNAVNLSDGLDGLATGLGIIAFGCLAAISLQAGHTGQVVCAVTLMCALLGFLPFNFNPAKIFLGDSGSLSVGYALATLPLTGPTGEGLPPLALFLMIAVPLTDTALAIARRFLSRCMAAWGQGPFWAGIRDGLRNTVRPDRRHIHHRLLDLGFSHRRTVLILYGASAATGVLACIVAASSAWPIDLSALVLGLTVIAVVRTLGFDELRLARSGLLLPVLHRLAARRAVVLTGDCCVAAAAYGAALWLTGHENPSIPAVVGAITMMSAVQLASFNAFGLYRTPWRTIGVSGLSVLLEATAVGACSGYVALRLLAAPTSISAVIVYGALLLAILTIARFAHPLLEEAVRRATAAERERAIICGLSEVGRHALSRLGHNGASHLEPIGFVELNAGAYRSRFGTLPLLGPLEALPDIVIREQVRHLVIAEAQLRGRSLEWVRAVCRHLGVEVHHYVEQLVSDDKRRRKRITTALAIGHLEATPTRGNRAVEGDWRRSPDQPAVSKAVREVP